MNKPKGGPTWEPTMNQNVKNQKQLSCEESLKIIWKPIEKPEQ